MTDRLVSFGIGAACGAALYHCVLMAWLHVSNRRYMRRVFGDTSQTNKREGQ